MKIRLNDNQEIVQTVREGLKRTGGYCPCRLERTRSGLRGLLYFTTFSPKIQKLLRKLLTSRN